MWSLPKLTQPVKSFFTVHMPKGRLQKKKIPLFGKVSQPGVTPPPPVPLLGIFLLGMLDFGTDPPLPEKVGNFLQFFEHHYLMFLHTKNFKWIPRQGSPVLSQLIKVKIIKCRGKICQKSVFLVGNLISKSWELTLKTPPPLQKIQLFQKIKLGFWVDPSPLLGNFPK